MAMTGDYRLGGVVHAGWLRDRRDRVVKNGRWYLIRPGHAAKVGWGDLAFADLDRIAAVLPSDAVFLALPEEPPVPYAATRAAHSDEAATPPSYALLAADALYAVIDGDIHYVGPAEKANRRGAIWVSPGHRSDTRRPDHPHPSPTPPRDHARSALRPPRHDGRRRVPPVNVAVALPFTGTGDRAPRCADEPYRSRTTSRTLHATRRAPPSPRPSNGERERRLPPRNAPRSLYRVRRPR